MTKLLDEDFLTLAEAAKRLRIGRNGKAVHVGTLHRWIGRGLRGIRLESCRLGGRRVTSIQALRRFLISVSSLVDGDRKCKSDASMQQAVEKAEKELDIDGI